VVRKNDLERNEIHVDVFLSDSLAPQLRSYEAGGRLSRRLRCIKTLFFLEKGFELPQVSFSLISSIEKGYEPPVRYSLASPQDQNHYTFAINEIRVDGGWVPDRGPIVIGDSCELAEVPGEELYEPFSGLSYKYAGPDLKESRCFIFLDNFDILFLHLFQMVRYCAGNLFDFKAFQGWKDQSVFHERRKALGRKSEAFLKDLLVALLARDLPLFPALPILEAALSSPAPPEATALALRKELIAFSPASVKKGKALFRTGKNFEESLKRYVDRGSIPPGLLQSSGIEEVLAPLGEAIFPLIERGETPVLVCSREHWGHIDYLTRKLFPELLLLAEDEWEHLGGISFPAGVEGGIVEPGVSPSLMEAFRWFRSRFDVFTKKISSHQAFYHVAPVKNEHFWHRLLPAAFAWLDGREPAALKEYALIEENYGESLPLSWLKGELFLSLRRTGDARKALKGVPKASLSLCVAAGARRTGELQRDGDVRSAELLLSLLKSLAPSDSDVFLAEGELLWLKGKRDRAIAALDRAVTLDPFALKALRLLAQISLEKGAHENAREHFLRVLAIDDHDSPACYGLGMLHFHRHEWDEASWHFHRALQSDPVMEWAHYRLGWIELVRGYFREAEERFRKALELSPETTDFMMGLGALYSETRNYEKACHMFEEAHSREPGNGIVMKHLARTLSLLGLKERACALFDEALSLNPADEALYYEKGLLLFEKEDIDGAIEAFRKALRLDPANSSSREALGWAFIEKKRFKKAAELFGDGLLREPTNEAYYHGLAKAFEARGLLDEAREAAEKMISLNPRSAAGYFLLGSISEGGNEKSRALEWYEKALMEEPGSANYLSRYLSLLLEQKAFRAVIESTSRTASSALVSLFRGRAFRGLGLEREAEEAWRQGLDLEPSHGDLYGELFFLYMTQGNIRRLSQLNGQNRLPGNFQGRMFRALSALAEWEIEEALQSFLDLSCDYPRVKAFSSYLSLLYFIKREYEKAHAFFEEAQRERKEGILRDSFIGELLSISGKAGSYEKRCRRYLKKHPDDLQVTRNLGAFLLMQGAFDEAGTLLFGVLGKDSSLYRIHQLCAEVKRRQGEFKRASLIVEEGRKKFPQNADMWANSAFLSFERGNLEEGEQFLRQAISLSTGTLKAFYQFALSWHKGEWEEVRQRFLDFPEAVKSNREVELMMSTTLMQVEEYAESLKFLCQTRKHCPDRYISAGIYYLEALIHWQAHDFPAAREALGVASRLNTGKGNALLAAPLTLILEGNHEEAGRLIRAAVKELYPFPEAYYLLGYCEEKKGKKEKAGKLYRGALRFSPYDRRYREAQSRVEG
jgi:tetratricopeptide (TPR) repeat protein